MRKLVFVLLSLMLVFTLVACTNTDTPPADTTEPAADTPPADTTEPSDNTAEPPTTADEDASWTRIQEQGYFILGLDDSFPPMGFRDENNEIVGFDIDLAYAVAEYLDVEVQLKPVVWSTVLLSLNSGEIDCIWNGMSVTEDRLLEIDVTNPYVQSNQIVVTLAGSELTTKADLAGKTVGTQMGSSTLNALNTEPEVRDSFGLLKEYATFTEAMMDLENKRLDAVVIDGISFYGDFNVKSPGAYAVMEENFGTEDMAIGVRKQDDVWTEKLNEAMQALKDNGTAAEISIRWFGEDILL